MSIKTSEFDYDLLINYYMSDLLTNEFWLFGADSVSTNETRVDTINAQNSIQTALEKAVFGLKLNSNDYTFMAALRVWQQNTVYDKYDDSLDMSQANFYVMIEPEVESGAYEIFKCLSNNRNSASSIKPQINPTINQLDGIYNLSDGYLWKYMGSIPNSAYRKFSAKGYIPIFRNTQVESIAHTGINYIEVLNPDLNRGYERKTGTVAGVIRDDLEYQITCSQTISQLPDYYKNMSLYVEKSEGGADTFKILSSRYISPNNLSVVLEGIDEFAPSASDYIEILPTVAITGTGTGTKAIPIFDTTNTRIETIRVLETGDDHVNASAEIVDPSFFSETNPNRSDIKCLLRPVIAPLGGHGSNIVKELYSKTIGISSGITSISPSLIPPTNTYCKVLLVKNPEFVEGFSDSTFDNRVKLTLSGDSPLTGISVGDIVSQTVSSQIIRGVVHELESPNVLYISDYDGPHSTEFSTISVLNVNNTTRIINSIEKSDYVPRSGVVLHASDFYPVERTADKIEQIKLVIDF